MCEYCDEKNKNLEEHKDYIEARIQKAHDLLSGNYDGEILQMMIDQPFPEDKPFMEFLFKLSSAAQQLALAYGAIVSYSPSVIMGEWAGIALETEIESGYMGGLASILRSSEVSQESLLGALFSDAQQVDGDETLH